MSVVCWTRDTSPIRELDAYKRAYEDERGHELHDVDHFELRCSPVFWRWMMALPTMVAVRDALVDEGFRISTRWRFTQRHDFMLLDNVRVNSRDDVDDGEARLSAVHSGERAVPLFTISAVRP